MDDKQLQRAPPGGVPETDCKRAFTDNYNQNNRVYKGKQVACLKTSI